MTSKSNQQQEGIIMRVRDYIAGSVGGITQVLIGQPFDTIKVRLQSAQTKISIIECIKDLVKNEGVGAFYKGTASPLICMSGVVSIQFGVFQNSMRKMKEWQGITELPIYQISLAGCMSGIACSGIVSPMEHIRIKMQLLKTNVYKNTFECAADVYSRYGLKGIFRGLNATLLREVPGEGLYFLVYEFQMRHFRKNLKENPILLTYSPMIAGGIAGLVYWMFFYPIDTLKSRLQGDSLENPKYKNFIDTYRKTVRELGFKALFKGVDVCAIRSVPVNACSFLAFEQTKLFIESRFKPKH